MSTLEPKKRNSPSSDHDDYDHEDDYERDEIKRHQKIMDAEAEREERKKMSEASNEAPTINHLELSEEELNEIYVINSDVHGRIGRAGDKLRQAIGATHNDSTHHRAIGAIDDLSHNLSTAHPEHRAILNQLKIAKQSLQRAANTDNNEEKARHIETARQIHLKAQNLLRIHQNNNMQRLSQQGVNINSEFVPEEVQKNEEMMPKGMSMKERTAFHNAAAAAVEAGASHFKFGGKEYPATMSKDVASKMNEEQIEEALSPEARKRRDKLKAEVRAAKDAYKQISKQAKSPKSGLAPLKTSVTPKEHESEDPEESARKHPIDRLRRIALSMKGGHFEYDNGEKHHISRDVARAIVKHYEVPSEQGGLKPFQKEKLQSEITKSHDHLMKHYKSISGTNESSFEPKKNGREMIIEKKPKKSSIDEAVPLLAIPALGAAGAAAARVAFPYLARRVAPEIVKQVIKGNKAANDPGKVVPLQAKPQPKPPEKPPEPTPAPVKPQETPKPQKPANDPLPKPANDPFGPNVVPIPPKHTPAPARPGPTPTPAKPQPTPAPAKPQPTPAPARPKPNPSNPWDVPEIEPRQNPTPAPVNPQPGSETRPKPRQEPTPAPSPNPALDRLRSLRDRLLKPSPGRSPQKIKPRGGRRPGQNDDSSDLDAPMPDFVRSSERSNYLGALRDPAGKINLIPSEYTPSKNKGVKEAAAPQKPTTSRFRNPFARDPRTTTSPNDPAGQVGDSTEAQRGHPTFQNANPTDDLKSLMPNITIPEPQRPGGRQQPQRPGGRQQPQRPGGRRP